MKKQTNQATQTMAPKITPKPVVTMEDVKDAARWCLRNHLSVAQLVSDDRAAIALAVLSLS